MEVITHSIHLRSSGYNDIHNLTPQIQRLLDESLLKDGQATIFAIGSTTGIATIEFEPGLVNEDINEMLEKVAPYEKSYLHNKTWGDNNGAAHLRSCLIGTSYVCPFVNGQLLLGTWQQVVFMDFDTRPRERNIVVQFMGLADV